MNISRGDVDEFILRLDASFAKVGQAWLSLRELR